MSGRKKLADVLGNGLADLAQSWDTTEAAGELAPVPKGTYRCRLVGGELDTSQHGTPKFAMTWNVIGDEYRNRRFWQDVWLTPAAMPAAKRDLGRLGITSLDQLEQPLPAGIVADVRVVVRADDTGKERNEVRSFNVVAVEADPTADPDFAEGEVAT